MRVSATSYYPIVPGVKVPLKVKLTPKGKLKKRVIYGIFDKAVGRIVHVGKTGQTLARRVSWYQCIINKVYNNPDIDITNKRLFSDIVTRSSDFSFTILKQASSKQSLSVLENKAIEFYQTNKENIGYNSNRGGGGGSAFGSPSCVNRKRVFTEINAEEYTPEKNHPVIENDEGRVEFLISPSTRKMSWVIYRIRQISTGISYVGKTETTVANRFSRHTYLANTEKAKPELHQLIEADPTDFDFGILYECSPGEDIDAIEAQFIARYRAEGLSFNKRNGGGGSHVSKKLNF